MRKIILIMAVALCGCSEKPDSVTAEQGPPPDPSTNTVVRFGAWGSPVHSGAAEIFVLEGRKYVVATTSEGTVAICPVRE